MLNGYNRLLATVAVTNDQRENLPAGRFVFTSLDVALLKMTRLTGMIRNSQKTLTARKLCRYSQR
jgi:hypothetical protein